MLKQKLSSLALPLPAKTTSPEAAKISNKTFLLEPNEKHLESLSFNFHDNTC